MVKKQSLDGVMGWQEPVVRTYCPHRRQTNERNTIFIWILNSSGKGVHNIQINTVLYMAHCYVLDHENQLAGSTLTLQYCCCLEGWSGFSFSKKQQYGKVKAD